MEKLTGALVEILWRGSDGSESLYDKIRPPDREFHEAAKREIQWVED